MEKHKQLDITFRFQPMPETPDGILLQYIKQQLRPVTREMVLKALRAYWLAEAYQSCGGKQALELNKLATNMIFALEEQANYLRAVFSLERLTTYQALSAPLVQMQASISGVPFAEQEEEEDNGWASVPQIDMDGL